MKRKSKLDPVSVAPKRLAAEFKIRKHLSKDKDTSSSMLDSLPLDLKLDILTRLPAKSLMNFRCVSNLWYSTIRSREFIDSFFAISTERPRLIVALGNGMYNSHRSGEQLVFFFSFEESESSSLVPNFHMAMPSPTFCSFSGSCTSVQGFLAVNSGGSLKICNPCTEQFFEFPSGTKFVGYDPIDDQYKAFYVQHMDAGGNRHSLEHKVMTIGGGLGWRHIEPPTTTCYTPIGSGVSINGFVYYGAFSPTRPMNPGIVCFDVRSEKLTYIKAPLHVVYSGYLATFIEYKGKLASIVGDPYGRFDHFYLWILQDVAKHKWSCTKCVVPPFVWDYVGCNKIHFSGTSKTGEIIMAPMMLPQNVQPFYIFYYNVETKKVRRVRLFGIGDNQEFRRSYGFIGKGECHVRIAPQHIESIAFFKNPNILK